MLSQLAIKNIVLIESAEISFAPGLCVLSGETGAGKSILLDALGLVLGARADAGLIRQGEAQGSVSAEFDIAENDNAQAVLAELGLEPTDSLIIRRQLASDGKTRCLANDQPVTVAALKKLGETLLEIHGQHDQKTLQDSSLHRDLLDAYARAEPARAEVAKAYGVWKAAQQAIDALQAEIAQAAREQDYLRHMQAELKSLSPEAGEEDRLTTQRATMMQSEKLFDVVNAALGELNQAKGGIGALRGAQRALTRSPMGAQPPFAAIVDMLERAAIEAEEASFALEKAAQDATFNPQTLERIEERLFALKAAGRKYNVPVDELAALYANVDEKLGLLTSQEGKLRQLQAAEKQAREVFCAKAELLSAQRRKVAVKLEKAIEAELAPLKMEHTRFRVRLAPLAMEAWSSAGMESVHFECATNVAKGAKDIAFSPLSKIASGGELSRFMLAMKVALASVKSAPTLIFDEIDTGTGGAVADAIGARLALLGKHAQVLVVTHLPQVAARGSQHLLVSKASKGKKIATHIAALAPGEREEELARMLAGATITPEARKAAQKLLEQAA